MGGFYGNITIKGSTQTAVANALRGRRAAVSPDSGDLVVVFDSACDDQDTSAMQALASRLTQELGCTSLAVIVHDDDVLLYFCCHAGSLVDVYNSNPNYFKRTQPSDAPAGGNARKLCELFNAGDHRTVHAILHEHKCSLETERHRDLVCELRLPGFTVGTALASLDRQDYPQGLSPESMVRAADPPPIEDPKLQQDRRFYDSLGPPRTDRVCKHEGCGRGAVALSVFCKPHHFEMVRGYPCPFTH